ncbi:hypothetical protein [Candidatus Phytoplasma melaleucae]|uniref:Uncharacterized protein n=1 Tax=Candidatus Phytoplasma melaleucae TaxID=2982630 RepID=A0ABT9DFD1_9MOLU|nr:hypothetical protein ['Melaleuca sp.' phytoplasma]MDO8168026.1 hypothetical protein ['Melaleuca sp.' phytoplasma]
MLDEFSYLLENYSPILSELQKIIDQKLSQSSIKLFLSGSHISLMEEADTFYKPLYGRTTFKKK